MTSDKNILIAFLLNLFFSVFELIGGIFTNSIAIISDALHDFGDSVSIGISYFLEKKSKQKPDEKYTYGYKRFSVLGSVITTSILFVGSIYVIVTSAARIFNPEPINYNGMIVFAVVGLVVNLAAAYFTREGDSLGQKAVNLHILEDCLGWAIVLVGAIVMRFTNIALIDSVMSIGVAIFILTHAVAALKEALYIFLERTPRTIEINEIKEHICHIDGVIDVHHIHIWSHDGFQNYATLHVVVDGDYAKIKHEIKDELKEHGIVHSTLELESPDEVCHDTNCHVHECCDHRHEHDHDHGHHHGHYHIGHHH